MQSKAQAKWVRMSPRKVRRVVNEIRGKKAAEAVTILRFMPFTAAREVEKVLKSAMYQLIHAEKAPISESDANDLTVVEAYADQGPTLKRIQPRARGRAYPILKKSSHITVVLSDV
ncbi:MAG TPA: 50S ribosomal protein L22 [Planktothrix sp.]|jgi:large subunit ribosomal protein L22